MPGPGQVLVRTELLGVNPIDWKMVAGYFGNEQLPGVPGWAATGTVVAVGDGVRGVGTGDAVVVGPRAGGFREFLTVDADLVVPRPAGMSPEQAAALPSSGVAGYSLVEHVGVTAGDTVLVHGAAGAVGSVAAQIAVHRGARVIGTASTRNHDYLRALGVEPVAYGADLVGSLTQLGPFTASIDAVGGQGSVDATVAVMPDLARSVTVWGDRYSEAAGIPWVHHADDELEQTVRLAAEDAVTVRIAETFPLEQAADALRRSMSGHAPGKILLRVRPATGVSPGARRGDGSRDRFASRCG